MQTKTRLFTFESARIPARFFRRPSPFSVAVVTLSSAARYAARWGDVMVAKWQTRMTMHALFVASNSFSTRQWWFIFFLNKITIIWTLFIKRRLSISTEVKTRISISSGLKWRLRVLINLIWFLNLIISLVCVNMRKKIKIKRL